MASNHTPGPSPDEELDSDQLGESDTQWGGTGDTGAGSRPDSPADTPSAGEKPARPSHPLQKRRRVTRACDECRRKKIKCDGKQPCTHCTVYSYECTYDQPSNRRRNPAPQYIEALESRLHKAEAILRSVLPGIDFDDPKFDARGIEQLIATSKANRSSSADLDRQRAEDDAQIQTMVDRTGSLDLDDQGHWDFHGHSSGYEFMRKFKTQFGDSFVVDPRLPASHYSRNISQILESPKSSTSSPYENSTPATDLPPREVALELCRCTLDDCCALMRPLHRPSFFKKLSKLYDTDPDQYTNAETQFLPLMYVVMALGCLFTRSEGENALPAMKDYKEAMEQGYHYFSLARQLVDITDCRDLISLQTVTFMVIFLQSSAKLSTCYAYLGIALRACCRLGLHRNVVGNFNTIEVEERKRLFWLIRKMDAYVGAMLGLPQMLSDEDIDQELPAEIEDDYIFEDGFRQMPPNVFPLLKATNAGTKLTDILKKVVRYIYPIKGLGDGHMGENYSISHNRIRELERDLQQWMDELPMQLRPSDNNNAEMSRVQQLLRMSYAHVQMMMYRPFIHYVSQACGTTKVDKRSFACAAACVSVARNIVHITTEMKKRGLLVGAYWFVMYTTYFAILSLIFFVLENPESPTGKDILRDAMEGRDTLASLAKRSLAADRCTVSLTSLFQDLPEKLNERRSSLQSTPSTVSKKRPPPGTNAKPEPGTSNTANIGTQRSFASPPRARTLPHDFLAKIAKRNSTSVDVNSVNSPFSSLNSPSLPSQSTQSNILSFSGNSTEMSSPASAQLEYGGNFGNPSHIPDLKNVMFPSDNPFAYPNQPISTLESASQFMTPEQVQDSFAPGPEHELYGMAHGVGGGQMGQGQQGMEPFNMSIFANNGDVAPGQYGGRHLSAPMRGSMAGFGMPQMEEPQNMGGLGGPVVSQEDYWTQPQKTGNGPMRTGLTPGGVNLDELFGAGGEGWGAGVWSSPGEQGWTGR